jgi:hypothetical protein
MKDYKYLVPKGPRIRYPSEAAKRDYVPSWADTRERFYARMEARKRAVARETRRHG